MSEETQVPTMQVLIDEGLFPDNTMCYRLKNN